MAPEIGAELGGSCWQATCPVAVANGAFDRIGSADVTLGIEMVETFVRRRQSAFDT